MKQKRIPQPIVMTGQLKSELRRCIGARTGGEFRALWRDMDCAAQDTYIHIAQASL